MWRAGAEGSHTNFPAGLYFPAAYMAIITLPQVALRICVPQNTTYAGKICVVDPEDYEELSKYKWYAVRSPRGFYAVRSAKAKNGRSGQKNVRMHRVILKAPEDKFIDHINHNGLDNRKSNLRICTMQQNTWNMRKQKGNCTSQYKGVTWRKDIGKWQARIICDGKRISIGFFDDEKAAAMAYDAKAKELFGEFAAPNLP